MTKVYSSPDWILVDTFRRVLESYGISSDAKGELPNGARGRTRITGLWVLDDAKAGQARSIIAQAEKRGPRSAPRRRCGKCREPIEEPYGQCWQCGNPRSETNA